MSGVNVTGNTKPNDGHIIMEGKDLTLSIANATAEELTSLNSSGDKFGEPSPNVLPSDEQPDFAHQPLETTIEPLEADTTAGNVSSSTRRRFAKALDEYFKITDRGSSIVTEIRGGVVGFLTVAYIVLLNPQVLSHSGVPSQFAASATCVASCIATLICGLWGNIPVGCAPGLGLTAYFVYGMVSVLEDHRQTTYLDGLLLVFLSGLIVFVLTVSGLVTHIVGSLAESLKLATIVGMGLFLAFVGMAEVGLVRAARSPGGAILELGDMTSWVLWLSLFNCLLIATLTYFKLNGSLLLCVLVVSNLYFAISGGWPSEFVQVPQFQNPVMVFNFEAMIHLPLGVALESVISFVLILLLDISGLSFAVATLCGLSDHLASFQKSAFIGCSIGTMIAAVLGCTPIIVCIETTSAVAAGARTGLSAVVIAIGFVVAMFFGPVLGAIPSAATSPVLIFIGVLMMGQVGQIQWDNMRIAVPAFFCIVMMPFTFSIANGLFFGVSAFVLLWVFTGQFLSKLKVLGFERSMDEKFGYSNGNEPHE